MRNPPKRYYGRGDLHFIAFNCYRRRPLLGTVRARDRLVRILDEGRRRHAFRLIGYVVMPEHVHLLIGEPPRTTPSKVLQVLKQKVAAVLLKRRKRAASGQLSLPFGGSHTGESHFWQRRFYDFNVWSEKKLKEKLDYVHANHVQRRLVRHPRDWPWSSWSLSEKRQPDSIRVDALEHDTVEQVHVNWKTVDE
jgi:putative transposase